MKYLALLFLVLASCAFLESAMKPASVGLSAGVGGMVGGPTGAGIGGAAVSAAWDVADAEAGEAEAVAKMDAITHAALTGELTPLKEALADEAAERTGLAEMVDRIIFWLLVALVVYILKQPLWAFLAQRRITKHVQNRNDIPSDSP